MTNNLRKHNYIFPLHYFIFLTIQFPCFGQVAVTSDTDKYVKQVKEDSLKKMVELKSVISGIIYDLRYATENNFMHRKMYPANTNKTFLRLPVAKALANVQKELGTNQLGLKIFDAYRPYSVTVKFWELVKDERYVANPAKGSGHNRGIAVDLTIFDYRNNRELDMGTGFDNFSDTAHWKFTNLDEQVLKNRNFLKTIMEKNGFIALDTEWWHFYWPNAGHFEVLDIPFKKLAKKTKTLD